MIDKYIYKIWVFLLICRIPVEAELHKSGMDYFYLSNLTWTCSDLSLSQTQAVNSVRLGITSLGIETEESVKFSRPITSNCGCVVWATALTLLRKRNAASKLKIHVPY